MTDERIYPSDLSRQQFEKVRPILEAARRRTKPRQLDLYHVFNAVLYVLKTGCQWRMLPNEYPKWRSVHEYFTIWRQSSPEDSCSALDKALKKWVGEARKSQGRSGKTSLIIVDAQSVKNTDSANHKGYDAGKKTSGIKRHIAVDTQGLVHAAFVTTANVTDRAGALAALAAQADGRLSEVRCVVGDGGYTGMAFAGEVLRLIGANVEIIKRSDTGRFAVLPKRWVVERTFSWFEKNRRLWKNCERLIESSLGMMLLANIALLLRRS
ncbi:MAG: IS5 family transposase [Gammaproteobacteria bacterium]|nr:IS5 family transposase [Gammaproteobacteria bacterium]